MDLNFRITTDLERSLIRVDFQKRVGSIGFTLEEAIRFRDIWIKHIEVLLKGRFGGRNNGERE